MGEWEWCLVLLEELEQLDAEQDDEATGTTSTTTAALRPAPSGALADGGDNNDEEQEVPEDGRGRGVPAPETVFRVELDESGALAAPATATSQEEAAAAEAAAAAYTAAVRACGEGGAGVQAVLGILERMRWAGVDPGEDAYRAAISAFRACGTPEGEASGRGVWSAEEAARALVDHETGRDGGADWASPFLYRCEFLGVVGVWGRGLGCCPAGGRGLLCRGLSLSSVCLPAFDFDLSFFFVRCCPYSAAVKACAEAGNFAAGRLLFVEGRRAAGVATDDAAEVAAAAVAAAAAAADSGTAPKAPARVNAGVEAVYMSCLTVRLG